MNFTVEQMPNLPGEPKEWQVSAPDGYHFTDHDCHALVAFSLAETRRMQTLRIEKCPEDCTCKEEDER